MIYDGTESDVLRFLPKKGDLVCFAQDVIEDTEMEGQHESEFRCMNRKWNYESGSLFVEVQLSRVGYSLREDAEDAVGPV